MDLLNKLHFVMLSPFSVHLNGSSAFVFFGLETSEESRPVILQQVPSLEFT